MLSPHLFLPIPSLSATSFQTENTRVSTIIRSTLLSATCPSCGTPSRRVHSRYTRDPAGLPVAGRPVTLHVEARRFYCHRPDCRRRTFSEPFPGFLARSRRRTQRLEHAVEMLGLTLGGEASARLAHGFGIRLSADTVLRTLRRHPLPPAPEPRVLGVDDWAFRRGHRYGTLLVDLERHRPIDLLPDRKTETLALWLKQHPGIQIISRDRFGAYAEGARQGAPQAVQVADRWHLLKNLRDVAERALNRDHTVLRRTAEAVSDSQTLNPTPPELSAPAEPASGPHSHSPTRTERNRLARYQAVCDLHRQGGSIRAIARHLTLDRRTVQRFLLADGFPERMARPPVPSLLDPFRGYLHRRWDEGGCNARQLFQEIVAQGFQGSESIVRQAIRPWRLVASVPAHPIPPVLAGKGLAHPRPWVLSPRQVSFWLLDLGQPRGPGDRDRAHTLVRELCARVPSL